MLFPNSLSEILSVYLAKMMQFSEGEKGGEPKMLKKDKRTISIALVSLLALSIFATTSAASAVPENPLTAILNTVNDIYNYLTGTIKPDIDGINAKTDAIKNQVDKGSQVLTRTETVKFLAGTPPADPDVYSLVDIRIDTNKAADFRVTVATWGGDWTPEFGDILAVGEGIGYGGRTISWAPIYIIDSDLADIHWQTEFTARWMSIYVQLGDTLTEDISIIYSYTVTTDAGATIVETITPPPTPPP